MSRSGGLICTVISVDSAMALYPMIRYIVFFLYCVTLNFHTEARRIESGASCCIIERLETVHKV